jgi:hypothetical protein
MKAGYIIYSNRIGQLLECCKILVTLIECLTVNL